MSKLLLCLVVSTLAGPLPEEQGVAETKWDKVEGQLTPCLLLRYVEEDANSIDELMSELRDSTVVPLLLNPFQVLKKQQYNAPRDFLKDVLSLNILAWGGGGGDAYNLLSQTWAILLYFLLVSGEIILRENVSPQWNNLLKVVYLNFKIFFIYRKKVL